MHRFLARLALLVLWKAFPISGVELDLLRTSVQVPAATVWHMASQSNTVFACAVITNFSSGIIAFDLSSPSEPRFLGDLPLPGAATQLAISGPYAFVAAQRTSPTRRDGAIHVVDIADPEHPVLKKSLNLDSPIRVTVSGNLLFVSDGGMQILDISDPLNPVPVSRLSPSRNVIDIAVQGNYAYAATSAGAILVIDIADISAPVLVNTVLHDGTSDDVEIANGVLFVTAGTAGLLTFDLSDPTLPRQLGSTGNGSATSVLVRENYAYVTGQVGPGGVRVFDVSDPSALTLAGQLLVDFGFGKGGYSVGLALVGTNAVCTTGRNTETRLNVMSIAPSALTRLATLDIPRYNPGKLGLAGSNLFYGRFTVDVSDPRHPALTATNNFLGFDALSDSRGIFLLGPMLQSFSIDAAGLPVLLGETDLSAVPNYSTFDTSVTLLGDHAFIGTRSAGLLAYDLRPDNPVLALQITNTGSINSVAGSGNSIVVIHSRLEGSTCCISAVTLYDVSNPLAPEPIAELDSVTNAAKAVLKNGLLLIADRSEKLHAFDVTDSDHLLPRGAVELRAAAASISINDGIAVVAEGANGYEVFEARSDRDLKRIAGNSAVNVPAIANRGPIIFASDMSKGLKIETVSTAEAPVLTLSAIQLNSDQTVRLGIEGSAEGEIIIQRSSDLAEWSEWQRIPAGTPNPVIQADADAASTFFRTLQK